MGHIIPRLERTEEARLFIALWPDDAVRHSLVDYRDTWHWQGRPARVRDDKLHITLHFLGNVARVPELRAALAVPCAAFDLVLGRPALLSRGVAVIEPLTVPEELRVLHAALGEALRGLGLPVESRPFRPHITLARHARQVGYPVRSLEIVWRVEGYVLMESRLGSGEYRVLERYPADAG
ncbi:MAG: RNA 2',3'-cyclic phosphodiesterase [Azoarcus sp.]|jgi:2'-5' RNA ligase|nr:RNA 2',3'-cyclic phosphodiesterase [Azoarcus sp.]